MDTQSKTQVRKAVSAMLIQLLLPALLFTRIAQTASWDQVATLGWLSLANVVYVALGLAVGFAVVVVTQPPRGFRRVLQVAPAIGHANTIPLMITFPITKRVLKAPRKFPAGSSGTQRA